MLFLFFRSNENTLLSRSGWSDQNARLKKDVDKLKRTHCEKYFENGTYSPDLIDLVEVTNREDANKILYGYLVSKSIDTDPQYVIDDTKPDELIAKEEWDIEAAAFELYERLAVLNTIRALMESDGRDLAHVDARIAKVQARIDEVYGEGTKPKEGLSLGVGVKL